MPVHIYICLEEKRRFELYQDFTEDALSICPDCGGTLGKDYSGLMFDASTRPTSSGGRAAIAVINREKRWNEDLPAYKRMRDAGLQPKSTDGAARIEREASTQFEVESGRIMPHAEKQIAQAMDMFHEGSGKSVFNEVTTPTAAP